MQSRVFKNTTVYMFAGLAPYFVGFFMLPVYTRFMNPADYGIVSLIQAFTSFLMPFMGMQLVSSVARFYFDYDEEGVRRLVSTTTYCVVVINLIILLPMHFLGPRVAGWVFPRANISYRPYMLLGLLTAFCGSLAGSFNVLLRVQEKGGRILAVALANTVLGVALGVYFVVYRRMGAHGVLLAGACNAFVNLALLFSMVRRYVSLVFDRTILKSVFAYSLPIVPHALGGILFMYSDKIILGYFVPLASIGLYNMADRISMLLKLVVHSFNDANQPIFMHLSTGNKSDAVRRYKTLITKWAVAIAFVYLGLAMFSEEIICVMTPTRYHAAYRFVPILLGAYVFRGMYCFAIGSVMFEKKTMVIPLVTFTAGFFNVIANILLIPRFGTIAAAWTTLGSFLIIFLLALYFSNRYYPLEYEWSKLLRVFSLTLLVFMSVSFLKGDNAWINGMIKILGMTLLVGVLLKWNYGNVSGDIHKVLSVIARRIEKTGYLEK